MLQDKELIYEKAGTLRIKQLPTSKALRYSVALGKIAVPIADSLGFTDSGNGKAQISLDAVGIVHSLMGALDEEKTPALIRDLVRDSVIVPDWGDGTWYESRFGANFQELFKLVEEIIRFNYGGALELLGKTMVPGADTSPESSEAETNPTE